MGIAGSSRAQAGFSLLEILVALLLLSITATILFQLFSRSSRNISVSEDYMTAAIVGEASMRQTLDNDDLQEGTFSQTKENGYTIEARITEVLKERTESLQIRAFDIDVCVKWSRYFKDKMIRLSTLKLMDKTGLTGEGTRTLPGRRGTRAQ